MEFKVGDKVIVTNSGEIYNTNRIWLEKFVARKYRKYWDYGRLADDGEQCTIKAKGPNQRFNTMLYYIQNDKTKRCYIINERGIKLIKGKYFKSLPDNYTGTLEIKNGLIVEKEILDDVEKEYLSAVIRPFKDKVEYIEKCGNLRGEYIKIKIIKDTTIVFPDFKKETIYKGMKTAKIYTLEELGLDKK